MSEAAPEEACERAEGRRREEEPCERGVARSTVLSESCERLRRAILGPDPADPADPAGPAAAPRALGGQERGWSSSTSAQGVRGSAGGSSPSKVPGTMSSKRCDSCAREAGG